MLHKKTDNDIDPDDIWDGDVLGREAVAGEIIQIMSTIKQPFVIGMSSRYGTGKTFFATRCVAELRKRNFAAVYFNAWQNDYAKEPLTGFIHTVTKGLNDLCGPDDVAEATNLLAGATKFIAKRALPIGARLLARSVLGGQFAEQLGGEFDKAVSNSVASLAEGVVRDAIDGYEDTIDEMEAFQDGLAALAQKARKTNKDLQHDQVVVFVDELDRCRPDYTIEILESIKHLFHVENFIFVLMSDDEAFAASVATVYSDKISADHYLRKFVDWKVKLPDPSHMNYAKYLAITFNLDEIDWLSEDQNYLTGREPLIEFFALTAQAYDMTLREMDQCFTTVNLVLRSCGNDMILLPLLAVLAVLKEKDHQQYKYICFAHGHHSFDTNNVKDGAAIDQMEPILSGMIQIGASQTHVGMRESAEYFRSRDWQRGASEAARMRVNSLEVAVGRLYETIFGKTIFTYSYGKETVLECEKHTRLIGDRLEALSKFSSSDEAVEIVQ